MSGELPHRCDQMVSFVSGSRMPVEYEPRFREFTISLREPSSALQLMSFCPWCGERLPSSLRVAFFDRMDELGCDYPDEEAPVQFHDDHWWRSDQADGESANDTLRALAVESGRLLEVRGAVELGERYSELALLFERGTLLLGCDEDTDEIRVAVTQESTALPPADDPEFAPLLGKVIEYAWVMTNHQGYADAFQLRLLDLASRELEARQFEVAASAMWVHRVTT